MRVSLGIPTVGSATAGDADGDFLAGMVTPEKNLVARLGILCIEIDAKVAKALPGLRSPDGLIIAAKSLTGQGRYIDLQRGDVIHAVNKVPVVGLESFRRLRADFKEGVPIVLLIEREGLFRYVAFEIE